MWCKSVQLDLFTKFILPRCAEAPGIPNSLCNLRLVFSKWHSATFERYQSLEKRAHRVPDNLRRGSNTALVMDRRIKDAINSSSMAGTTTGDVRFVWKENMFQAVAD